MMTVMLLVDSILFAFDLAPLFLAPAGWWMLYRMYKFQGEITSGPRNWLLLTSVGACLSVAATLVDVVLRPTGRADTVVNIARVSGLVVVLLPVLLAYLVAERNPQS